MGALVVDHDAILRVVVDERRGHLFKHHRRPEGGLGWR
jgi:hypothetical protein